jgi:hypothetical protein
MIEESRKQVKEFQMQLAGPHDDISEILSRNLFTQHKPLVYSHDEFKPDFDEDMLCKSTTLYPSAFDEPTFFGIEDKSYRKPERNKKLQHHIDLLSAEVTLSSDHLQKIGFIEELDIAKQFSEALELLCVNSLVQRRSDPIVPTVIKDTATKKRNRRKQNRKKEKCVALLG